MSTIKPRDITVEQIQSENGIIIYDPTSLWNNEPLEWEVIGKNQDGNNTITLQTKRCLCGFAWDTKNTSGNTYRQKYGSNQVDSLLHQWLNSDEENWYSVQHDNQEPSSSVIDNYDESGMSSADDAGFMTHLSSQFKERLITVTKGVFPYSINDPYSFTGKLFCPSVIEIDPNPSSGIYIEDNGFTYQRYAKNWGDRVVKDIIDPNYNYGSWRTRTPSTGGPYAVNAIQYWTTSSERSFVGSYANDAKRLVAPACVLPMKGIELEEDGSGKYRIIFTDIEEYEKVYAKHEKRDGSYELKSYWTSSQTVEFDDGQILEDYKGDLKGKIDAKGDGIDYSLDDREIYLYSGNTKIATEDMQLRTRPNIALDDISNLSARVSDGRIRFTWSDPSDVVFSELTLVEWAGTKVVRRTDSVPDNVDDGTLVVDSKNRDQYSSTPYFDNDATPGSCYYYRFFPYDTDGNYYGRTGAALYIQIQLVAVDIPYLNGTYTYTGSNITPTFTNYDTEYMTRSGTVYAKNAGDYSTTFTLKEGYKWSDDTTEPKTINWSIGKADVTVPTVTSNLTYTGSSQSPTITGFDSNVMTKSGDESAVNAGDYTLTISLSDTNNYKFATTNDTSIDYSWSIGKANGVLIVSPSQFAVEKDDTKTINITEHTGNISVTGVNTSYISVTINNNEIMVTGVNRGDTNFTIVSNENNNYTSATQSISISITSDIYTDIPYGTSYQNVYAVTKGDEIHAIVRQDAFKYYHYMWNGDVWNYICDLSSSSPFLQSVISRNSVLLYNNEIHILGCSADKKNTRTEHCKWDGNEWTMSDNCKSNASYNPSFAIYNNKIHQLGADSNNRGHYAWDGNSWTSVSTLPYYYGMRTGKPVVEYNNELHVLGFTNYDTIHAKWNGTSWTSVSTLPASAQCAVVFENTIHIFASSNHYKLEDGQWVKVSTLPVSCYNGGTFVVRKNKLYYLATTATHSFYCWNGTEWIN